MGKKAKIAFVLANGWGIKGFVHSRIMEQLAADFELGAWAQPSSIPPWKQLIAQGGAPRTELFPMPSGTETALEQLIRQAQSVFFYARNRVETEAILNLGQRKPWQRFAAAAVAGLARTPIGAAALKVFQRLRLATGSRPDFAPHFDSFKPDLVVMGHPLDRFELRVAYEAHKRGIPVVASVLSWDNLTTKGMMPDWFAEVLVWNETMRDEVLRFYPAYKPEQVHIVGVPRFDVYKEPLPPRYQREPFLRSLGLDPSKRILFHANSATVLFPEQMQVIRHIERAMRSGELPNCQMLVRQHPRDEFDIEDSEFVKGWRQVTTQGDVLNWWPDAEDPWILAAMIRHADVNINPASTITLESAICDVPIVNVAYDGDLKKPYESSVIRFYDFSHQPPMLRYGATVLSKSREEMIAHIRQYLATPELHRQERMNLANSFCSVAQGSAVQRAVSAIRGAVSNSRRQ